MNANNQVKLSGRLGADPELKETSNGKVMARIRMATDEGYRNTRGEWVSNTQWHLVVAWGKIAQNAAAQLVKGQEVQVEGRLMNRSYTDKDGHKRYITEVVADTLQLAAAKQETA